MKDKKKYLSFVSKALPLDFPAKKQYLDEISGSVKAYCIEHPAATFEELCRKFGTAEEIAESIAAESEGGSFNCSSKKEKNKPCGYCCNGYSDNSVVFDSCFRLLRIHFGKQRQLHREYYN